MEIIPTQKDIEPNFIETASEFSLDDTLQPNTPAISDPELNIVPSPGGSTMQGGAMQSPNFSKGNSGWRIGAEGDIEANDGTFRGELRASSMSFSRFNVQTFFETVAGGSTSTTGSGSVSGKIGNLMLGAGPGAGTAIYLPGDGSSIKVNTKEKSSIFETGLINDSQAPEIYYWGVGDLGGFNAFSNEGYGFKNDSGTLYGVYSVNSGGSALETTTALDVTGITLNDFHIYRAVYDVDEARIDFYIDGIKKGELLNPPFVETGSANDNWFMYYVEVDGSGAVANLSSVYATFTQDS